MSSDQAYIKLVQGTVAVSPTSRLQPSLSVTFGRPTFSSDFMDREQTVCFIPASTSSSRSLPNVEIFGNSCYDDKRNCDNGKVCNSLDKISQVVQLHTGVEGNKRAILEMPYQNGRSQVSDKIIASSDCVDCVIKSEEMSVDVSIPGSTIVELVQYWGTTSDNNIPAFVSVDEQGKKRHITRKEILDFAQRFAHKLQSLGIGKGSIVCNALPNSLERVISEFGIHFSGAVSMNGQIFRADGEDFLEALRTAQCCAVICDPHQPKGARHILTRFVPAGCENNVQSDHLPDLKRLILCMRDDHQHENDFITSLRDPGLPEYSVSPSPSDLATIMTTSGSTGYSKLVKLTHANICHFGKQVKAIEPLPSGAHFINCAPLGWAGGFPQWYLSCGVTRYFLDMHDGPISDLPGTVWKTIVQEKIVYGFLSPMYVNAILTNSPWQNAEWKPKTLCLAGQQIKKGLLDIIGKLCDAVDINYGITECNLVTTHRIKDPASYIEGCAGYPGYGVKVKVVDKKHQEVPCGTKGEVLLWSPSLCSGYLNNDKASNLAFTSDGWFCTDDTGYVGQDGKLYVEGRQSDSIVRGAYILYPGWLEKKFREFPGVKDITIVAVPDKVLYNEICACVVVSIVKGVVAGGLTETFTNHQGHPSSSDDHTDIDHVDNTAFLLNNDHGKGIVLPSQGNNMKKSDLLKDQIIEQSSGIKHTGDSSSYCESANQPGSTKISPILSTGTKVKSEETGGKANTSAKEKEELVVFERELRDYANNIELLHEKDAMRMVPKYYIFMDAFPLTNTGKVSRKEIRHVAASVLGLDAQ